MIRVWTPWPYRPDRLGHVDILASLVNAMDSCRFIPDLPSFLPFFLLLRQRQSDKSLSSPLQPPVLATNTTSKRKAKNTHNERWWDTNWILVRLTKEIPSSRPPPFLRLVHSMAHEHGCIAGRQNKEKLAPESPFILHSKAVPAQNTPSTTRLRRN